MPTILTFTQPAFIYKIPNEIGFTLVYRYVEYPVSIKENKKKYFFVSRKLCRVPSFSFPNNFPKEKFFTIFKKMFNFTDYF